MATNMTENQRLLKNKTSNTNKMLFTTFPNMRSIMVLLLLCKEVLITKKIVCYVKANIIVYKVCDVNSIPANLRNKITLDN